MRYCLNALAIRQVGPIAFDERGHHYHHYPPPTLSLFLSPCSLSDSSSSSSMHSSAYSSSLSAPRRISLHPSLAGAFLSLFLCHSISCFPKHPNIVELMTVWLDIISTTTHFPLYHFQLLPSLLPPPIPFPYTILTLY
jgi:hypothetical protein